LGGTDLVNGMKNRGLYGQDDGSFSRASAARLADRLADNDAVEGPAVAVLAARAREGNWRAVVAYAADLCMAIGQIES